MRYSQSEKMEVIRTVENSSLGVRRTLKEFDIRPSTFYNWYKRYLDGGYNGLSNRNKCPKQFWNAIPDFERKRIIRAARKFPEKSCRELAFYITDNYRYFVSESSVYRILKAENLISAPAYTVISAKDKFSHPTTRINQLWQIDFTYFKIISWGWYYLLTVLDDYSRYIIAWELCNTMKTEDVKGLLDIAIQETGVEHVDVLYRPRLLSDNGSCFISKNFQEYLKENKIPHTRGKPYHPQTQGKIERYHRSMKNLILLDNYYTPDQLRVQIEKWVEYYNHHRYHEAINNVTPADKYAGNDLKILKMRKRIKQKTMKLRRKINLA